jgi:hypothetical protein
MGFLVADTTNAREMVGRSKGIDQACATSRSAFRTGWVDSITFTG